MKMYKSTNIRNVAVVGHGKTGKTSLLDVGGVFLFHIEEETLIALQLFLSALIQMTEAFGTLPKQREKNRVPHQFCSRGRKTKGITFIGGVMRINIVILQVADKESRALYHCIFFPRNNKFCRSAGTEKEFILIMKMRAGSLLIRPHIKSGFIGTVFDQKIFFG